MNTSLPILVELLGGKGARAQHPLPRPVLAPTGSLLDRAVYHEALGTYYRVDATLARYRIESMACESGSVVRAQYLNFRPYAGQTRHALLLSEGVVQLIPTPRGS